VAVEHGGVLKRRFKQYVKNRRQCTWRFR
jgi:hypothetical protein